MILQMCPFISIATTTIIYVALFFSMDAANLPQILMKQQIMLNAYVYCVCIIPSARRQFHNLSSNGQPRIQTGQLIEPKKAAHNIDLLISI